MTLSPDERVRGSSTRGSVRQVLSVVLVANLLVAGAKLFIGWRAGSLSILGDAAHSGFDSLNNVIALLAVRLPTGGRPTQLAR